MESHFSGPKILLTYHKLAHDGDGGAAIFCGGAQKIASQIAVHLSQRHWRVCFASDDPPSARNVQYLCDGGVTHVRMPFERHRKLLSSVRCLTGFARTQGIDLMHCHDRPTVVAGAIACKLAGIPMVYTAHNIFHDKLFTRPFLGHHTVAVSEAVRQNLEQEFQRPPGSVRLIYNGVEVNRSTFQERRRLRQELGLQREDRIISMVGRLVTEKGHLLLLEAIRHIINVFPDLRVLLVGDGPLRRQLEELAHHLNLTAHVIFCGHRANATQFVEISEFMVAPSLREGLPLAVLEALALGVPVVASSIASHREIMAHGDMGLLVAADQPLVLAEAILFMLRNQEQVHRMGQRCFQTATRDFGLPRMLAQYEGYYTELLRPLARAGRRTGCL